MRMVSIQAYRCSAHWIQIQYLYRETERDELLTFGFIREIQRELIDSDIATNVASLSVIPHEVYALCALYFGDNIMLLVWIKTLGMYVGG